MGVLGKVCRMGCGDSLEKGGEGVVAARNMGLSRNEGRIWAWVGRNGKE